MAAKDVYFGDESRGKMVEGVNILANAVKVGDSVLYGQYSGTEIKIDGKAYLIMRESDVYGVFN